MKKAATADDVREYALITHILPARKRGDKTVSFSSAGILHGMGLQERFPLICSAIDAEKFLTYANVALVKREGPRQSSTVRWVFEVNS
jgi:5-methylcytosine-specific restriction protein B